MLKKVRDGWKLYGIWRALKMPNSWKKMAATALAAVVVAIGPQLGLTADQSHWIAGALMTFILGQGAADFGKNATK
jgi:hypothetical protein